MNEDQLPTLTFGEYNKKPNEIITMLIMDIINNRKLYDIIKQNLYDDIINQKLYDTINQNFYEVLLFDKKLDEINVVDISNQDPETRQYYLIIGSLIDSIIPLVTDPEVISTIERPNFLEHSETNHIPNYFNDMNYYTDAGLGYLNIVNPEILEKMAAKYNDTLKNNSSQSGPNEYNVLRNINTILKNIITPPENTFKKQALINIYFEGILDNYLNKSNFDKYFNKLNAYITYDLSFDNSALAQYVERQADKEIKNLRQTLKTIDNEFQNGDFKTYKKYLTFFKRLYFNLKNYYDLKIENKKDQKQLFECKKFFLVTNAYIKKYEKNPRLKELMNKEHIYLADNIHYKISNGNDTFTID